MVFTHKHSKLWYLLVFPLLQHAGPLLLIHSPESWQGCWPLTLMQPLTFNCRCSPPGCYPWRQRQPPGSPQGWWCLTVSAASWILTGLLTHDCQCSPLDLHRGADLWPSMQDPNRGADLWLSMQDPNRGADLWLPTQPSGPQQGCWPLTANAAPPGPQQGCRPLTGNTAPQDPNRGADLWLLMQPDWEH